jgi:large subunit ribosomal protein L4
MQGEEIDRVDLPAEIFEAPINRALMHQAYVRQLANARLGTHDTKTRAEVTRTGAKIWRQKGTGRARHGSRRAPIFKGGGVAHGPHPRSYEQRMPKKMRRAALRSALSVKAADNQLVVVADLTMDAPKTKDMTAFLGLVGGRDGGKTLVLMAERNEMVERSVRNLPDVKYLRANYLNIRDLLGSDMVVMPLGALDVIKGYLGTNQTSDVLETSEVE